PEQRAQPRRQLAQVERLAQEVVGPRLQAAHLVLGTVEGREQQDGQASVLGVATHPLTHLDATGRGHHHVEADEIGLVLGDRTERGLTVDRIHDVVTLTRQELAEEDQGRGLVVNGKDQWPLTVHGSRPSMVSAKVVKSIGLLKYSSNPAASARSSSPSMAWAVKATMRSLATGPGSARSSLSACQPSMSGSPRSMSTRSGSSWRANAMPSAAVSAENTSCPAACSSLVASALFAGVSSITRIVAIRVLTRKPRGSCKS